MEISGWQVAIDLFFLTLCLGIIYIAISRGIISESLRTTGLLLSSLFAFQYYTFLGNSIKSKISLFNENYLYLISFLVIFLGVGTILSLLRLIVTFLFKREKISLRERWLCFFLGAFRAAVLSSVIIFLFYLVPFNSDHFVRTTSYAMFKNVAPKIYHISFRIYQKIYPNSAMNKQVEQYMNLADNG